MNYLSVCSGIEAATVAWHDLGWKPVGYSEIEPFPSAVLAHHYPNVTNYGDMTKYKEWSLDGSVDLIVGGTPCQSFSVAGLRKGMDDPRGDLALVYCGMLDHFRPKWFVWENVPGVLSSSGGRDFGSFLGALAQLGYGFAYRVLDAQYFGVAQRRRRVFVVGHLADWRPAAAVLFERGSLRRDNQPSREKRKEVAGSFIPSVANCLQTTCHDYSRAEGFNAIALQDTPHAFKVRGGCEGGGKGYLGSDNLAFTLSTHQDQQIFFEPRSPDGAPRIYPVEGASPTLNTMGGGQRQPCVTHQTKVRRLTPVECERLQGFSDDYTLIPWKKGFSPDSARYKALGNSMAVPVMQWIGDGIDLVDSL